MALSAGTMLGPYSILTPLGKGGMGEVYRARDTRLDRTVAIKVLQASLADDPQLRERFDREARIVGALNHPHICTLFDVGRDGDIDFLVMEYLEGMTLEERLVAGALPLDEGLRLGIEIADALDKAHRAGIVHRDLKPGNVMLVGGRGSAARPSAKLLDFGLAKSAGPAIANATLSMLPTTPPNLTSAGAILGTFRYMAPEQLEGHEADARTDLFAFGVVLFEMLTGQQAFASKTPAGVIGAIMRGDLPRVSAIVPSAPAALDRVVSKCLAKDPDARWQTARDLKDELRWIAEGGATTAIVPPPTSSRLMYAGWIVATLAVLVALAVFVDSQRRDAPRDQQVLRVQVNGGAMADPVSFALSPDGRQLVFVATADGVAKLWLRPLDAAEAHPLAGTEGASFPFWSPDSRAVGFFAEGKVKRLDLDGGRPRALADAGVARGGAWNRDGDILFSFGLTGLRRVKATGGPVTPATQLAQGEGNHRWPMFLPDGHHFLFFVSFSRPEVQGVYVGELESKQTRRLLAADTAALYAPPGYLLFMRQGVLMSAPFDATGATLSGDPIQVATGVASDANLFRGAFTVSGTGLLAYRLGGSGKRQIVLFDRAGAETRRLAAPDEQNLIAAELAPDGRRLGVFRTVDGNGDIWLMDTSRGVPTRFTSEQATDDYPTWSPDATHLVFRSNRNGVSGLFARPSNGAGEERTLIANSGNAIPNDWSPDGREILFSRVTGNTGSDIWSLGATGTPSAVPVVQSPFDEDEAQFSPDGHWIAYRSNESGRPEVYVRPYPGPGNPLPVSTSGGEEPRWRRDGKELFYLSADRKLMAVPITRHSPTALDIGSPAALFAARVISVGLGRQQYSVAADGQHFWMNVVEDDARPSIEVVQNWTGAMKR